MKDEVRTVTIGDTVIGQVFEVWQQVDPYTWEQQWHLSSDHQPISFDTYDEASAYLMGYYDAETRTPGQ